jgi:electron transport complex protein RnfG
MQNKKDTMIKDTLQLFLITLVAGCLLGLVYEVTKAPIEAATLKKKQEAYQAVYAEAVSFEENADLTAKVEDVDNFLADKGFSGTYISEVLEAKDSAGETIGYVMNFGSNEGYGGQIDLSFGIQKDGTITGLSVISMSETAGLGAKCTGEDFQSQFKGIRAEQIGYVKADSSTESEGEVPSEEEADAATEATGIVGEADIDALSGATITTKAVTKAVNAALAFIYENCEIGE